MFIKVPNKISPFKITLFIAILGVLWFLVLDWVLYYTVDPECFPNVWIIKDLLFLLVGSGLLYLFFKGYFKRAKKMADDDLRLTVQNLENFVFKFKKREDGEFVYTFSEGKIAQKQQRTTEAVYGKTLVETSGPKYAKLLEEHYHKAYQGDVVNYELQHRDKILYTTLAPIIKDGKIVEIVGATSDITDLKRMEEDLKKSNQRVQNILESITEGFFAMDDKWRFSYINTQGAKMLLKTKFLSWENLFIRQRKKELA
jgi:hypothetical protein